MSVDALNVFLKNRGYSAAFFINKHEAEASSEAMTEFNANKEYYLSGKILPHTGPYLDFAGCFAGTVYKETLTQLIQDAQRTRV